MSHRDETPRIGIFARIFPRDTLGETLSAVGRHCRFIQLNLSSAGLPTLPDRFEVGQSTEIAQALERAGIELAAVSGTFNMIDPDRSRRAENLRRLDLLASHIADFRAGRDVPDAPRADHHTDCFVTRRLDLATASVLVVEGTYVLTLEDSDVRIFLEATHEETGERRRQRNRDVDAPIIDRILAIEHAIIALQARRADILVDRHFGIRA